MAKKKPKITIDKPPTGLGAAVKPSSPYSPYTPSIKGQGAPAPASPPPGYEPIQQQPFDPEVEAARLSAQWNVGIGGAEVAYQTGQTAYESGYDANGLRNNANPYSQAKLLEDNWKRSLMGAQNSYAAQGQYNSGAYGRAKAREDRLYAQGSDRLQRDTANAYHGIGAGQLQNYASNALGVSADTFAALRRAVYGS